MSTATLNYHWTKPDVGGDGSAWGTMLNGDLDAIDAKIFTNETNIGKITTQMGVNTLTLNKATVGAGNPITGQSAGLNRWVVQLGNGTGESGSNTGSDFTVQRYTDAGALIDAPLTITRSSGAVAMPGALSVSGAATVGGTLTATNNATVNGTLTATTLQGVLQMSGHKFNWNWAAPQLQISVDAGAALNGACDVYSNGTTAPFTVPIYAMAHDPGGARLAAWTTGGTGLTWSVTVSDRRLKSQIADAAKDALAAIKSLKLFEFDLKMPESETTQHWRWGLMADEELEAAIPSSFIPAAAIEGRGEIYASVRELPLIAALVKAVQQLAARVETLEAQLAK